MEEKSCPHLYDGKCDIPSADPYLAEHVCGTQYHLECPGVTGQISLDDLSVAELSQLNSRRQDNYKDLIELGALE